MKYIKGRLIQGTHFECDLCDETGPVATCLGKTPLAEQRAAEIVAAVNAYNARTEACKALVAYVEYRMDDGERPCPLCGHHYIHTTAANRNEADREYEHARCPYPLAKAALEAAGG